MKVFSALYELSWEALYGLHVKSNGHVIQAFRPIMQMFNVQTCTNMSWMDNIDLLYNFILFSL